VLFDVVRKMKSFLRYLRGVTTPSTLVQAEDKMLPAKDPSADWTELEGLRFSDWTIKDFIGWDEPFDGGSSRAPASSSGSTGCRRRGS
jgi:hypothetical protein